MQIFCQPALVSSVEAFALNARMGGEWQREI